MRRLLWLCVLAGCGSSGAARPEPAADAGSAAHAEALPVAASWSAEARAQALSEGAQVIAKHQCTRCHVIDALPGAGRPFDCVSCHVFLKKLTPGERRYEDIATRNGRDVLERYQKKIVHLVAVPDLSALGRRVRPAWLRTFLAAPEDLRPHLEESMPRTRLDAEEIEALARYFAAVAEVAYPEREPPVTPAAVAPERLAQGRAKFEQLGCQGCHALGNQYPAPTGANDTLGFKLAPNLRYARERIAPEVIVRWILKPSALAKRTEMPSFPITTAEAELLRDFIVGVPLDLPLARAPAPLPSPARRAVSWDEVKERVLGDVCVHCHMNDHEKDQGAGNTGGLGYLGSKLSLRTYERAVAGARDPDGVAYSVFITRPGEAMPPIVAALKRRREEAPRDVVAHGRDHLRPPQREEAPGMPLGLPPLSDEQIGLLLRWIADGCPGPRKVSGKPGFDDGYLVPDGPIAKNRGCELRAPAARRPSWAVAAAP